MMSLACGRTPETRDHRTRTTAKISPRHDVDTEVKEWRSTGKRKGVAGGIDDEYVTPPPSGTARKTKGEGKKKKKKTTQ